MTLLAGCIHCSLAHRLEYRLDMPGVDGSIPSRTTNAALAKRLRRWVFTPETEGSNPSGRTNA